MYAAQVSGVIAVVVYGLYGSATAKWGLSPKVAESGIFDDFWDTIGFAITGMVFFFSGVSCVNFFVRSAQVTGPLRSPSLLLLTGDGALSLLAAKLMVMTAVKGTLALNMSFLLHYAQRCSPCLSFSRWMTEACASGH